MTPPRGCELDATGAGVVPVVEADGRGSARVLAAPFGDGGTLGESKREIVDGVAVVVVAATVGSVSPGAPADADDDAGGDGAVTTEDEGATGVLHSAERFHPATPRAAITPATSHIRPRGRASFVRASLAGAASPLAPAAPSSARSTSSALAKRSDASFSRHRITTAPTACDTVGALFDSGDG